MLDGYQELKYNNIEVKRLTGLKRGVVKLEYHKTDWEENAKKTIELLHNILGTTAIDIQHIGSTAVKRIHAKPIIDIAVGVNKLDDITPYIAVLNENGIIFRGEDVKKQLLFVIGDFSLDTRTHHIHIVKYKDKAWNNYINFRDYLNAFEIKAQEYDSLKLALSEKYPNDRNTYTSCKQELINKLLTEAARWKEEQRI